MNAKLGFDGRLTSSDQALRKLLLIWGIFSYLVRSRMAGNKSFAFAEALMKRMKPADRGDFLLMIAGTAGDQPERHAITVHQIV